MSSTYCNRRFFLPPEHGRTRSMRHVMTALIAVLFFVLGTSQAQAQTGPQIVSDKADYAPAEVVTLTGSGWQAGESVHIFVNDDGGQSWNHNSSPDPVADANGVFVYSFQLPVWFVANYGVTAGPGSLGSGTAYTTFTDLAIGTYDQCSNDDGDGYASGDTGCRWINGNLQSNNSTYAEGDATVQRLWLNDLAPGTSHSVTFKYGTTKAAKHAYDYLTTWNWSENWITAADRCEGITGCDATVAESVLDIPQDPNAPDSFEPNAPGQRQFVMRGGTLTSATAPVVISGDYAGDSETVITLSFTVNNSGAMCETKNNVTLCSVAIWFGAHVARSIDWGIGSGAASISGSPYHVALDKVDNASVGQRDNQMQSGTIVANGSIRIVKDAVPDSAQDFSFNLTNGSTLNQNFSLDDDADGTLPNSQVFSVAPGTYTAQEINIPAGWSLTNLVCVDPSSNSTVNLATATATIVLASAETVTCTYTDSGTGRIIVRKETTPDGASQQFEFDPSYSATNFSLSDGQQNDSGSLSAGTYSVAEVNIPAGWSLDSATCDDGSAVGSISLQPGETVTCTFNNSRDLGSLKILKTVSNPDGASLPASFSVDYNCGVGYTGNVSIAPDSPATVNGIPTGNTCSVTEVAPAAIPGYTWGTISYTPASVVIATKDSTFEITVGNSITRDRGSLKILKTVSNPDGASLPASFSVNYDCGVGYTGNVSIAPDSPATVNGIPTGNTCSVTEVAPDAIPGYTWGTISYTPASVVIETKGGTFEITVGNSITRDRGSIKILKTLSNPDGATVPASFSVNYDCGVGYTGNVSIAPDSPATVNGIPTGNTCSVTEVAPDAIPGYTWGTISYAPASVVIETKGGTFEITVGNSITRDRGSLKILKSLGNLDGAPVPTSFSVNYDCGVGYTGNVSIAPGSPATVNGIPTGNSCSVTEVAPDAIPGYTWGTITYSPASIVIETKDGTFEITVVNSITRDRGSLKIIKTVTGTSFSGTFNFNVECTLDGGNYTRSINYPTPGYVIISDIPTGASCSVSEAALPAAPSGYAWGTPIISGSPAVISKDTIVEVTVANKLETGHAKVIKTVAGLPVSSTNNCTDPAGNLVGCTFQLRQGATVSTIGTVLKSMMTNSTNGGILDFGDINLTPGQTYQMCEVVMPGWSTNLGTFVPNSFMPPDGVVVNPNVDNSVLCGDFVAVANETTVFEIDNTPPPGGRALTIGFWKNWSSCSSGKQAPILDQTLAKAEPTGIVVSAETGTYPTFGIKYWLVLHGSTTTLNVAPDCLKAVRLLNKSTTDTGKKMASDPAFNMAAQLLAAELNYSAGAGKMPAVTTAINQAVLLLGKYKFDGKTHTKISNADATTMNQLAKLLDNYNNNRPLDYSATLASAIVDEEEAPLSQILLPLLRH